MSKQPPHEPVSDTAATLDNNVLTVQLITKYLDYCSEVVRSSIDKSNEFGASGIFSQIGDDLVITPDELVRLIDKVQVALDKVD